MKKIFLSILLILSLLLTACQTGGGTDDGTNEQTTPTGEEQTTPQETPDIVPITEIRYEIVLKLLYYRGEDEGIEIRSYSQCEHSQPLLEALSELQKTDETTEPIASGDMDLTSLEQPAPVGTIWIEADSKIYRINPDFKEISLVESHFGAGEKMACDESMENLVADFVEKRDYFYSGIVYNGGRRQLTRKHIHETTRAVTFKFQIKDMEFNLPKEDSDSDIWKHKIILVFESFKDQTINITLDPHLGDVIYGPEVKTSFFLKAGESKTVELIFQGWELSGGMQLHISTQGSPRHYMTIAYGTDAPLNSENAE